jgi:hypothetical protein
MAIRGHSLLLAGVLSSLLSAGFGSAASAKGDDLPLNIRIVGLAGERNVELVSSGDLEGALAFDGQVADLEEMATSLVFGSAWPGARTAPGLVSFYEIDFTQPLVADRFPWNEMRSPHFYFYPAHGSVPAYLRVHVTRGPQPAVDGWLLARPEFTQLIAPRLDGLTPIHTAPQPSGYGVGWWLGPVVVLLAAGVLVFRRIGYFMPVVAMPRTK